MLATDIDAGGGVARHTFALLQALRQLGVRSYLFARNYSGKRRWETAGGVTVRRSATIGRIRPVNSAIYLSDVVAWLVRHSAEYDVVHCQQMSGSAIAALLAKRITRKPVLVRVTSCGEQGEIAETQRMAFARVRKRLLTRVDRWVALTNEMKQELVRFGVESLRIAVIPNGTTIPSQSAQDESARQAARSRLKLGSGGVVVYSGRLSSEKGVDILLRAWKLVEARRPGAQLIVLGSGGAYRNVETKLKDLTQELGLQAVSFAGHVSNVDEYLIAADVFVLPSRTEGMSNSLVEAMAAGSAIVATDIPANRELLSHDYDGLLFKPDDVQALASAIGRLLAAPAEARRLGRAARCKAEGDLSVVAMARRYMAEYQALLGSQP